VRKLALSAIVIVLFCAGCDKEEKSMEANALTCKFNELVKQGKTTRDQEKAYIEAVANETYQLDRAIRGTKKADATHQQALLEAQFGTDTTKPLNLEKLKENGLKDKN
jgi:hypothetical protein